MKRKIVVNKKIVIPALLILMLVVIGGVTYAYFTAGVEGNSEAKNAVAETGTMSLEFDGTNVVELNDALPGAYHEINFSVTNTGSLLTTYDIDIINVINTFVEGNPRDLVYKLESTNYGATSEYKQMPVANESIAKVVAIKPGVTQAYKLTLHFKETGSNQNNNQGKVFSGLIQINNSVEDKYLASEILTGSKMFNLIPAYNLEVTEEESGIYIAEDDDGESYYFRGNVKNNYVDLGLQYSQDIGVYVVGTSSTLSTSDFSTYEEAVEECLDYSEDYEYESYELCEQDIVDKSIKTGDKMLFRIVRINGDKSIRLISDNIIGKIKYNDFETYDEKYLGYVYDENKPSTIKTYLDDWYNNNLSFLSTYIIKNNFCNDTSAMDNSAIFNVTKRVQQKTPILKCSNTTKLYGGNIESYIGMLTADEAMLSGYKNNRYAINSSYLSNLSTWWLLSPTSYTSINGLIYVASNNSRIMSKFPQNEAGVRPVINLVNDIKITGGDGTINNPYTLN